MYSHRPVQPARFPRSKTTAFEGLSGKSSGPRGPRRSILLASSRHSAVLQPFPVPLPTWGEQTGSPRLDIGYHHGIRNPNSSRLFAGEAVPAAPQGGASNFGGHPTCTRSCTRKHNPGKAHRVPTCGLWHLQTRTTLRGLAARAHNGVQINSSQENLNLGLPKTEVRRASKPADISCEAGEPLQSPMMITICHHTV